MGQMPPVPVALQPHCGGPADAWLLPRLQMRLRPVSTSIHAPVAKLGGQPAWLDTPTWPLSRTADAPMKFVGQFPVPGDPPRLAYLFITDDGDIGEPFPDTYRPAAGENALLVQPGGRIPPWVTVTDAATGPSLWRRGATWDDRVPVELAVDLAPLDPAVEAVLDAEIAVQEAERAGALLDLDDADEEDSPIPPYSYLGGKVHLWQPRFLQIDAEWPIPRPPCATTEPARTSTDTPTTSSPPSWHPELDGFSNDPHTASFSEIQRANSHGT